jgi:hypothetical protein
VNLRDRLRCSDRFLTSLGVRQTQTTRISRRHERSKPFSGVVQHENAPANATWPADAIQIVRGADRQRRPRLICNRLIVRCFADGAFITEKFIAKQRSAAAPVGHRPPDPARSSS